VTSPPEQDNGLDAMPAPLGMVYDGDLLRDTLLVACPTWMSDEAVVALADDVLARLAAIDGVTVLRGMDSKPWKPS